MPTYAHSKPARRREEWQLLADHLRNVAKIAQAFASKWSAGEWGFYAGLWHDLGKYGADWQEYLIEVGEKASVMGDGPAAKGSRKRGPDHKTAGAIHARRTIDNKFVARVLEFAITAHHGGLSNEVDLDERMQDQEKQLRYAMALEAADRDFLTVASSLHYPDFFPGPGLAEEQKRRFELFIRMVFSSLVDADFLDTEKAMEVDGERSRERLRWPSIAEYIRPLDDYLRVLPGVSQAAPEVLKARSEVLQWCIDAALGPRGAYTLTVPTGGGKTLASLAFALRHASAYGLDRIVVALPFLSILDQTAGVYRDAFERALGERVLVEHHSNIKPDRDTVRNRLAAENWDAPLIVTTQVQLFESLFARHPSDCRKLHNLANSVLILDEVQTLPVGLLDPILEVLQELTSNYGTSLVLMTATQPALHTRNLGVTQFRGLSPLPREIVPVGEIPRLFGSLRRVAAPRWPSREMVVEWPALAGELARHRKVLAVVHRRADAADLWRELNAIAPGAVHLSALMCPEHRRNVLKQIRERLDRDEDCRVVSTQLVEAGVDLDFPVVFRAMAGLESLAQAAGRCNRHGRLARGEFHVFRAVTEPVGSLKHHKEIAETMIALDPSLDLFAPQVFKDYFDRLYAERDRDSAQVQVCRQTLQFEVTADRFQMIPDVSTTVFVPYGEEGAKAIQNLRKNGPSRDRFRELQPFGVGVYPQGLRELRKHGAVELLPDSEIPILISPANYDPVLGLLVDREPFDNFIV